MSTAHHVRNARGLQTAAICDVSCFTHCQSKAPKKTREETNVTSSYISSRKSFCRTWNDRNSYFWTRSLSGHLARWLGSRDILPALIIITKGLSPSASRCELKQRFCSVIVLSSKSRCSSAEGRAPRRRWTLSGKDDDLVELNEVDLHANSSSLIQQGEVGSKVFIIKVQRRDCAGKKIEREVNSIHGYIDTYMNWRMGVVRLEKHCCQWTRMHFDHLAFIDIDRQ
jgi:hypothetical protein